MWRDGESEALSKVEQPDEGCGSRGDSQIWGFPEPALSPATLSL